MAELARTIITPIANLADAIEMSIFNGQAQATFSGRATTASDGSGEPTHCISSGWMDETIIAGYEADPRFFVSDKVGRVWRQALTEHDPDLYELV